MAERERAVAGVVATHIHVTPNINRPRLNLPLLSIDHRSPAASPVMMLCSCTIVNGEILVYTWQ